MYILVKSVLLPTNNLYEYLCSCACFRIVNLKYRLRSSSCIQNGVSIIRPKAHIFLVATALMDVWTTRAVYKDNFESSVWFKYIFD